MFFCTAFGLVLRNDLLKVTSSEKGRGRRRWRWAGGIHLLDEWHGGGLVADEGTCEAAPHHLGLLAVQLRQFVLLCGLGREVNNPSKLQRVLPRDFRLASSVILASSSSSSWVSLGRLGTTSFFFMARFFSTSARSLCRFTVSADFICVDLRMPFFSHQRVVRPFSDSPRAVRSNTAGFLLTTFFSLTFFTAGAEEEEEEADLVLPFLLAALRDLLVVHIISLLHEASVSGLVEVILLLLLQQARHLGACIVSSLTLGSHRSSVSSTALPLTAMNNVRKAVVQSPGHSAALLSHSSSSLTHTPPHTPSQADTPTGGTSGGSFLGLTPTNLCTNTSLICHQNYICKIHTISLYQNKIEVFGGRVQIFGRLLEYKYPTVLLVIGYVTKERLLSGLKVLALHTFLLVPLQHLDVPLQLVQFLLKVHGRLQVVHLLLHCSKLGVLHCSPLLGGGQVQFQALQFLLEAQHSRTWLFPATLFLGAFAGGIMHFLHLGMISLQVLSVAGLKHLQAAGVQELVYGHLALQSGLHEGHHEAGVQQRLRVEGHIPDGHEAAHAALEHFHIHGSSSSSLLVTTDTPVLALGAWCVEPCFTITWMMLSLLSVDSLALGMAAEVSAFLENRSFFAAGLYLSDFQFFFFFFQNASIREAAMLLSPSQLSSTLSRPAHRTKYLMCFFPRLSWIS
ncbi:hypothetical protein E2C01_006689 [Portunus trituberculatus]|uniref:Uncharacterized protein n=1 Tax=Portunus trituberculatus TaxID=210409 RepID=A0A5B7CXG8_PORTR|nr:hypothetical protein [Portunus trituberculatus]